MRIRCRLGLHDFQELSSEKIPGCEWLCCKKVVFGCMLCPKMRTKTYAWSECEIHMDFFLYLTTRGM